MSSKILDQLSYELKLFQTYPEQLKSVGYSVEVWEKGVIHLSMKESTRSSCFVALTHGNEVGGLAVLNRFIEKLIHTPSLFPTSLTFVLANPDAAILGRRFLEKDLNRSFGLESPQLKEEKLAQRLIPILMKHQFCLDFHQTIGPTLTPFFIYEDDKRTHQLLLSLNMAIPIVTYHPPYFVSQDGGKTLDDYLRTRDILALTVELGEVGFNPKQVECGVDLIEQTIMAFSFPAHSQREARGYWIEWSLKMGKGVALQEGLVNFKKVDSDDCLAKRDGHPIFPPGKGVILFPNYNPEVKGGDELLYWAKEKPLI